MGTTAAPPIEVHDLTVAYRKKPVLWDIDFELPEGALVGLVGPNGAGKSTLIKAIMGLLPVLSGYVRIYGQSLEAQRELVGYVPQRETVDWDFPVNALDVVTMGRYGRMGLFARPSQRDYEIAMACLDKVGMADFARRQISQLSGGQQQRVFLARALTQDASIYLMDEPFAGVDAATEQAIIDLLKDLKTRQKTVMVVHHDLNTAEEYFDYIMLLNMRLVKFGPTAEVFTPENLRLTYGGKLQLLTQAAEKMARQA
ncbi:MAG: metal ABC transporter ATP-binding protein [candidate division Zixibacteria bacterium]|jgi:manganese/zinc/iron transport system ATP- binding protein|nr:metal ABC transporter ATP-binding protein [candidate division Zixibacteria bacterium]